MRINKRFTILYLVLYSLAVIAFYGNDLFMLKIFPVSVRTFYPPGPHREMLRAIIKGDVDKIENLVEHEGADVNQLERSNVMSFLKFAFLKKQKECFVKLLDYGAHPDIINHQRHVFSLSAKRADPFYFEKLLEYKQNFIDYVPAISGHEYYPEAINQEESLRRYKLVYEAGADPNMTRPGWPVRPIDSALYSLDWDRVLVLLKHGVLLDEESIGLIIRPEVNFSNEMFASQASREDVAAYIKEHYGMDLILEDFHDRRNDEDFE